MIRFVILGHRAHTTADFKLRMRFTLDYFTGYRSALYNYATLEEGGIADFDWFHQRVY